MIQRMGNFAKFPYTKTGGIKNAAICSWISNNDCEKSSNKSVWNNQVLRLSESNSFLPLYSYLMICSSFHISLLNVSIVISLLLDRHGKIPLER